jgi:hypothetical protein
MDGSSTLPRTERARGSLSGEHVVVGAGISGLYAALLLARAGRRVRVLERRRAPGGLAGAEIFRGIPCDLGSHRLHPAALERPLFREMHRERPFLTRPRRGVLVLGDRHLPYPPGALSLARLMGPRASLSMALGLLARGERRRAFRGWEQERTASDPDHDAGFERFVTERVGEAAYRAFYKPYAEKVWGIAPSELSQTVAKKRVSTTDPWSLLRGLAGRAAALVTGQPMASLSRFVYPSGGTSSITAFLEERLRDLGVEVELGRAFCPGDGRDETVLFSGDLADLVPTPLEHRGLYLVYLALPLDRLREEETYYCPDPRCWFGRVSELQNYAPGLRRPGETILCVEIPEGTWGRGVDFTSGARLEALLDQLDQARIAPRRLGPLEVRQRFVPSVYPLYRRGWMALWRDAMARVEALGNVIPFGRQALFLHCNLDHCADVAADAVDHVERGGDVASWIRGAEQYLTLRVRD